MLRQYSVLLGTIAALMGSVPAIRAAETPHVLHVRTQAVGDRTYFHVRLEPPADMEDVRLEVGPYSEMQRWKLAWLPQLVPQDKQTRAVYQRLAIPHYRPTVGFDADSRTPLPVRGLEFVGQVRGHGKAKFLLLYPKKKPPVNAHAKDDEVLAEILKRYPTDWIEVPVELDFSRATVVKAPRARDLRQAPMRQDLEGLWAEGQVARFAVLEALAPEFGFYGFACAATGRRYGVRAPYLGGAEKTNREQIHRQLYETTTGAAAITESLQLHRMLS